MTLILNLILISTPRLYSVPSEAGSLGQFVEEFRASGTPTVGAGAPLTAVTFVLVFTPVAGAGEAEMLAFMRAERGW